MDKPEDFNFDEEETVELDNKENDLEITILNFSNLITLFLIVEIFNFNRKNDPS